MQEVTSTTTETSTAASSLSQIASGGDDLGQEEFLNLLVTQLRNQDPLNPTENSAFVAELATFSNLEASKSMESKLDQMLKLEEAQLTLSSLSQGADLVGREVEYLDPATGEQLRGTARSVFFDASGVLVEVDGTIVPINNIVIVSQDLPTGSEDPQDPAAPSDPTPPNDPATPPTGGPGSEGPSSTKRSPQTDSPRPAGKSDAG